MNGKNKVKFSIKSITLNLKESNINLVPGNVIWKVTLNYNVIKQLV